MNGGDWTAEHGCLREDGGSTMKLRKPLAGNMHVIIRKRDQMSFGMFQSSVKRSRLSGDRFVKET
jgi:hypothetical protein